MRQSTYLNVILTVNAVLLTGILWTQLASGPALVPTAQAQTQPPGSGGVGIPNAADQRQRMIESLREIKGSVEATRRLLESGKVKVEVSNIDRLKNDRSQ